MKNWMLFVLLVLAFTTLLIKGCAAMGDRPSIENRKQYERSPRFDRKDQVFKNRIPDIYEKATKRFGWREYLRALRIGKDSTPKVPLPEEKPDLELFISESQYLKIIWIGHSSLMLNIDGSIVLIDPVISKSASPVWFLGRRFQPSVISMNEFPDINYVFISHDHYDHLDMNFIKHLKESDTEFLVPLGVGNHLRKWGVSTEKIKELDWWESVNAEGLKFIATPAQHSSGRNPLKANDTLWASWVIKGRTQNLYFSGDSGYDIHFKEIGDRYGPFSVAFVENGQYDEMWPEMHLHPNETIEAVRDLRAQAFFPIHWGMFNIAYHPWYESVAESYRLAQEHGVRFISPRLGEIVEIDNGKEYENWWEQLVPDH